MNHAATATTETLETLSNARTALATLHSTSIGEPRFATYADMIRSTKLNFEVEMVGLATADGSPWTLARGSRRTDTKAQLGTLGNVYHVLQNVAVGETLDALMAKYGGVTVAKPKRVRVFGDGEVCSLMLDLPEQFTGLLSVRRDNSKRVARIIAKWSHDGSCCFTLEGGIYRVICENGAVALDKKLFPSFKIKHTKQIDKLTSKLGEWLKVTGAGFGKVGAATRAMDAVKLSDDRIAAIVGEVLDPEGKETAATKKNVDAVIDMVAKRDGQFVPEGDVTLYSMLEAFTAYDAHLAPVRADTVEARAERRELRVLNGEGVSRRAYEVLNRNLA